MEVIIVLVLLTFFKLSSHRRKWVIQVWTDMWLSICPLKSVCCLSSDRIARETISKICNFAIAKGKEIIFSRVFLLICTTSSAACQTLRLLQYVQHRPLARIITCMQLHPYGIYSQRTFTLSLLLLSNFQTVNDSLLNMLVSSYLSVA